MIKFQCIFNATCLRIRQSDILTRGLRSKAILGSQWVQSSEYGCFRVQTVGHGHGSPTSTTTFDNYNNFPKVSRSVSTLGNENGIKSARTLRSCAHKYDYKNLCDNDKFNTASKFKVFSPTTGTSTSTNKRQFSTSSDNKNNFLNNFLLRNFGLMRFNNKPAMPPNPIPLNIFKQFLNKLVTFGIRMEHDKNFNVKSFLEGAKMAICTVSAVIAEGHFDQLKGLVDEQARNEIQFNCSTMSERKRRLVEVKNEDTRIVGVLYLQSIKIIHEKKGDVALEASVVLFCLRNTDDFLPHSEAEEPSFRKILVSFQLCKYIFHKKLVKDTENSWTIHRLEHFGILDEKDRI